MNPLDNCKDGKEHFLCGKHLLEIRKNKTSRACCECSDRPVDLCSDYGDVQRLSRKIKESMDKREVIVEPDVKEVVREEAEIVKRLTYPERFEDEE